MAAGDDDRMYLENLEEFINDEDKIVTYKWLSRTLSVSANKAKQMLYAFVKAQQETQRNTSHSITYVVGGQLNSNGNQVQKYVLVTDQDLEDTKKQFSLVTCVHVYSVQKSKPKDSNSLYTVDYNAIQEYKEDQNRWSHICCKEAKHSPDRGVNQGATRHSNPSNGASTTTLVNGGISGRPSTSSKGQLNNAVDKKQKLTNEKTRKGQMSALEMFTKKPNSSSEKKGKEDSAAKADETKKTANSKPGSMKSFFGKTVVTATKANEQKEENTKMKPENNEKCRVEKSEKSNKPPKDEGKEVEVDEGDEEEPVPKNILKRVRGECDTEGMPQKEDSKSEGSKRRTKKKRAFIHNSDEESEGEKPTKMEDFKENKSKRRRKRMKDLSDDGDSQEASAVTNSGSHSGESKTSGESIPNAQPQSENARRRKRRKVLRSKTYMNEDGYMVTEKVWESESTDASDEEEGKQAAAGPTSEPKVPAAHTQKRTRSPDTKKTNRTGRQAALTSFFQKS